MSPFYKLSDLLKFEPLMDESIKYFHKRLETEFIDAPIRTEIRPYPLIAGFSTSLGIL